MTRYLVMHGSVLGVVGKRAPGAQLRKGVLEYCVLAVLERREHYGFELVRTLGDQGGLVTSEGTVYPLLARLRKEGHVVTNWQESDEGPPRKYYSITPQGRAALKTFRDEWRQFSAAVDALMNEGSL